MPINIDKVQVSMDGTYELRIACGRTHPYQDCHGRLWLEDKGYNGGDAMREVTPRTCIADAFDEEIYRGAREGYYHYTLDVPPGRYLVRLHFCEFSPDVARVGERIFDVRVGDRLIPNVDMVQMRGRYSAIVLTEEAETNGEPLDIWLTANHGKSWINAIEVLAAPCSSPPIPLPSRPHSLCCVQGDNLLVFKWQPAPGAHCHALQKQIPDGWQTIIDGIPHGECVLRGADISCRYRVTAVFQGGQALNSEEIEAKAQVAHFISTIGIKQTIDIELAPGRTLRFALVPPGQFLMGSPLTEEYRRSDEPLRLVWMPKPYYLSTTPVTQQQYALLMGYDRSHPDNRYPGKPADHVRLDEAQRFCSLLGRHAGVAARIPTEAEFEYALRAGSDAPWLSGSDWAGMVAYAPKRRDARLNDICGLHQPNNFGMYDMAACLWHWVSDWYERLPCDSALLTDPHGPTETGVKLARGGHAFNPPMLWRSACRHEIEVNYNDAALGFRVAIDCGELSDV